MTFGSISHSASTKNMNIPQAAPGNPHGFLGAAFLFFFLFHFNAHDLRQIEKTRRYECAKAFGIHTKPA